MNKDNKRTPGRPREFDLKVAQTAILDEFWRKGYSATSVDDLSRATGMVKPSLYSAFGNKYAMYQMAVKIYSEMLVSKFTPAFIEPDDIRDALESLFKISLDVYCGNDKDAPRGCLFTTTTIAETHNHPEIGKVVREQLALFDKALEKCLIRLCPDWSASQVKYQSWIIMSSLNHMSTCARLGMERKELEVIVACLVNQIAGSKDPVMA
ncbi:MAG: TetR/AcrR family transcriptional regulator [Lentilitoribacter sp.]